MFYQQISAHLTAFTKRHCIPEMLLYHGKHFAWNLLFLLLRIICREPAPSEDPLVLKTKYFYPIQPLTKNIICKLINRRKADSHKGSYGHALLIAGSRGKTGAAVIAAKACLRSGAGLVTVCLPPEERAILQIAVPEAMVLMQDEIKDLERFSAIGIGPGMGTDEAAKETLGKIIADAAVPLLLDADAITLLAADQPLFESLPSGTILTPHPKEFDRLFGEHEHDEARRMTAIKMAEDKNIVIVLKGYRTLITSGGRSFINSTGNPGLAKGGSGDALTGIISSFLAQGYGPAIAAMIGVYLHGRAADIALKDQSPESMLITDVIGCLGKAFKKIVS